MNDAGWMPDAPQSFSGAKILIYSHDTFGLGHLRRCREIAHALVEAYSGVSVLIISGATIAGAFDYRSRVDFVKVPSVIKLRNGEYTSLAEHIPLEDTLNMRRTIIEHTAKTFDPNIFIVDKEPVGLRGEIEDTLAVLKARGTRLVLGLREVMDAPRLLAKEWAEAGTLERIQRYYDAIWIYGPQGFNDPLKGLEAPPDVRQRMRYTGFLRRRAKELAPTRLGGALGDDYILVTTGGGGDGEDVIRQVLAAYAADQGPMHPAVISLGPYLPAKAREDLKAIGETLPSIQMIDFDNRLEDLIAGAAGVVGMAGYNTFCEILSFDRPSLLLPRTQPREEQLIRAQRASALGLAMMLLPEQADNPTVLARVLRDLPTRPRPSEQRATVASLDGLDTIVADVGHWLSAGETLDPAAIHA
ncbi:MAG: glycosyltransferase [Pseudomonadota bacterium]